MRALRIPLFILLALAAVSLAHSAAMTRRCDRWVDIAAAADRAAAQERWDEAEALLQRLEADWESAQGWLRITVSHNMLDDVGSLLTQARLLSRLREETHMRSAMAELISLLRQIDEGERLSWENIL